MISTQLAGCAPGTSPVMADLERAPGHPAAHFFTNEQGRPLGGSSLFDARAYEAPPAHRLTLAPRFGKTVVGTCSCGDIFEGHSSDAVSEAFNRSGCNR